MSRRYLAPLPPLLVAAAAIGAYFAFDYRGDAEGAMGALYWGYALGATCGMFELVFLTGGLARDGRRCSPEARILGVLAAALLLVFGILVALHNQPSIFGPLTTGLVWALIRCARRFGVVVRATPLAPSRRPDSSGPAGGVGRLAPTH